ncbi:MAG: hypothetical protein GY913_13715 [Proteobacteria bacterium]|nr:hypothetical protein [Pseudomonadota bacterium]MCP4917965.1 hypothetical protein [Pseudomonadota bacterium]
MGESPAEPRCSCGHGRGHVMVSPEPEYSGWQTFVVFFMGVTAPPKSLSYRCRVCREVFFKTTDPEELRNHT